MSGIPRAAVIATHDRPAELRRCVDALRPQVDLIVVVDNASDPPVTEEAVGGPSPHILVSRDGEQPPNLSRLWNVGLDCARWWLPDRPGVEWSGRWDVAVVNDDATVPPGWFDALSWRMREWHADAASHDPFGRVPPGVATKLDDTAPMSVLTRLAGWAFILRGEWEGARFDERLRWWCADDLVSLRARQGGGMALVGGLHVPNEHADQSTTGALAEQTGLDRATFVEITGRQPW